MPKKTEAYRRSIIKEVYWDVIKRKISNGENVGRLKRRIHVLRDRKYKQKSPG